MFAASQATKAGLNRQQLANLVNSGVLERAGRGIYISPGGLDDALYWIQQRAKKIIYSHETALFLHRMTSRTPIRYSVTVPSSYKASEALKKFCKIYYIRQDIIEMGKTERSSAMGHNIVTYDIERTLCDIIRSRNRIDNQIIIEALKNYAQNKIKDLHLFINMPKSSVLRKFYIIIWRCFCDFTNERHEPLLLLLPILNISIFHKFNL